MGKVMSSDFIFLKKNFLQEKNGIFDMGVPIHILGGGVGGLPTWEFFPHNTVFF